MPRRIYEEDHEALRASAREFVERSLKPRAEEMIRDKAIPRDIWKVAGKQGFFGFDIPEEYGGTAVGDYRFSAVLAAGVGPVQRGDGLVLRHPLRRLPALHRRSRHRRAEAALAARHRQR